MQLKQFLYRESNLPIKFYNEMNEKRKTSPDGGWGYLVAFALPLTLTVTLMAAAGFGLVFGSFLSGLGDDTTIGTVLTMGVYDASCNFTGFLTNGLLSKFSYRVVALMGAFTFTLGSISTIFAESLWQVIVFYGLIEGIGCGLMVPAFYTALNTYFDKKLGVVTGLVQTLLVGGTMAVPTVVNLLMGFYGFRGTLIFLAAFGLHAILGATILQPVKWHVRDSKSQRKPRLSIISINSFTLRRNVENSPNDEKKTFWQKLVKDFDLSLLKDPSYLNISIGLSMGFVTDLNFISILPLVLVSDHGLNEDDATSLLTLFFAGNLAGSLFLSLVNACSQSNSRYLFLTGVIISAFFRTLFNYMKGFWWTVVSLLVLGFFRAFIQIPLPLVLADKYGDRFANAYSLFMVICGIVSLSFALSISLMKTSTENNAFVVDLLTCALMICTISWIIEFIVVKFRK